MLEDILLVRVPAKKGLCHRIKPPVAMLSTPVGRAWRLLRLLFMGTLICGLRITTLHAETGPLRAEVFYNDGSVPTVTEIRDRTFRFDTVAGPQSLAFSQLRQILLTKPDSSQMVVETVAGDRWTAEADHRQLARHLPLSPQNNPDSLATHIRFERDAPPDWPPVLNTRMTLQDASVLNIDASRTVINLRHPQGVWKIPVASADIISLSIEDPETTAFVWFQDEYRYLRGSPVGSKLETHDRFGRSLAIPWDQIKTIRTLRPFSVTESDPEEETAATARKWQNHDSARWQERRDDGAQQSAELETTVWTVETAAGTLQIPSPRIHRILNDSHSVHTIVRTTADELLLGVIRSGRLREANTGNDGPSASLATAAFDWLEYDRSPLQAVPDWPAWRLKSGDVFYACFAERELTVQGSGRRSETIRSVDVTEAYLHEETGAWILQTESGKFSLPPRSRSVEVLMAVNGMRITLPWDAVESVRSLPVSALPPSTSVPRLRQFLQNSILIIGGEFRMGRLRGEGMSDEVPAVTVKLSSFIMDATPVTRAQFAAFVRDSGYRTDAEQTGDSLHWRNPGFPQRGDDPVVFVSWADAAHFCNWRSRQAGLEPCYDLSARDGTIVTLRNRNGFRLPTETEWEYAARAGGRDILYPWGDEDDLATLAVSANFRHPTDRSRWPWTTPVKQYPPNALGLHDMAGNVWEWCEDWYFEQAYQTVFRIQPNNPLVLADQVPGLIHRVMRGGSFQNDADWLRCASRGHGLPTQSANRVGFRSVRNATEP